MNNNNVSTKQFRRQASISNEYLEVGRDWHEEEENTCLYFLHFIGGDFNSLR